MIRKPIITVLGHVDHGKTSLLDKIRQTNIADREAGRITQHIGATEIPLETIQEISGKMLEKYGFDLKIPGLLFIDTPGHEAFANLRKRGGSIADFAILVIDITQGCQPQTFEALDILKVFRVPFIVGLNKVDLIFGWNAPLEKYEGKHRTYYPITESLKNQNEDVLQRLDESLYKVVGQLYEKAFVGERFDRINDFTKNIAMVPISASTGEGLPELLGLISALSQKYLAKKLEINPQEQGKGVILEIKEEKGFGLAADVILYDGVIREKDLVLMGGKEIVKSKVKALLQPKALNEIREPGIKFSKKEEIYAAAGLKLIASDLEKVFAGSPLLVFKKEEDVDIIKKELSGIEFERAQEGLIVKADTLGSLEALVKLLENKDFKVKKAEIGDVSEKDVKEAYVLKTKKDELGVILAFNVKVSPEAIDEAANKNIELFASNVIYKIIEDYMEWLKDSETRKRRKLLEGLQYPCKFTILRGYVFRKNNPAIVGVKIIQGVLKKDSFVMNKEGKKIGKIKGLQIEKKNVEEGKKGEELAVSIEGGNIGRNLFEDDELYTMVSIEDYKKLKKLQLGEEDDELLNEIFAMQKQAKE